jgi:hypothetical protein
MQRNRSRPALSTGLLMSHIGDRIIQLRFPPANPSPFGESNFVQPKVC